MPLTIPVSTVSWEAMLPKIALWFGALEPLRPRVPLAVLSELEWGDHRFPDILSYCHNLS